MEKTEKSKVNKFLYNCGELVACYNKEEIVIGWIESRVSNKFSGEKYYFVVWGDRPLWPPQKVAEEIIAQLKVPLNELKGNIL